MLLLRALKGMNSVLEKYNFPGMGQFQQPNFSKRVENCMIVENKFF